MKNLVIKMMNVSVGRAGVNNSFPEHILMIRGRIIEQVSVECRVQV